VSLSLLGSLATALRAEEPIPDALDSALLAGPDALAARLEELGDRASSALARAQNSLAAGAVSAESGDSVRAVDSFRRASDTLPRLAVAGLLYRAVGKNTEPDELLQISLEQTLKHSPLEGARAQAALELSFVEQAKGDLTSALALLDSLGPKLDDPNLIERKSLLRLALGEPVAAQGKTSASWSEVEEVFDRRKVSPESSPSLLLLRAARALRTGEFERFVGSLQDFADAGQAGGWLGEDELGIVEATRIALLFARKSTEAAALARAKDLVVRRRGGKLMVRLLARLGAALRDGAGIALALEAGGPGSAVFDASEQVLLTHLGGERLSLPESESESGDELREELAWAISGRLGSGPKTRDFARARLGAKLGQLDDPGALEIITNWAEAEPEASGDLLGPLVQLFQGSQEAEVLQKLAQRAAEPALEVLAARWAEHAGLLEQAAASFERAASSSEPALALEGVLGLDRTVGTKQADVQRWIEIARKLPAQRGAEIMVLAALALEVSESAAALREAFELAPLGSQLRPFALLGSYVQERRAYASTSRADALEDYLNANEPELASAVAFILAFAAPNPEESREALSRLSPIERKEAIWERMYIALGDPFELLPWSATSTWAAADHFLAHAASGDRRGAYDVLVRSPDLSSPLLRSLQKSLELELGVSGSLAIDLVENTPSENEPEQREAALVDLVAFEEARNDIKSAEMWRRLLVNEGLGGARVLLGLETEALESGELPHIRALGLEVSEKLSPGDAAPYLAVEAAFALGSGELRATRRAEGLANSPFLLRTLVTEAWDRSDLPKVRAYTEKLTHYPSSELDRIGLGTELARLESSAGEPAAALARMTALSDLRKTAFVPALLAFEAWEQAENLEGAAPSSLRAGLLSRLAEASLVPEHQVLAWLEAGSEFERVGANLEAERCFESCLAIDPSLSEAFGRLRALCQGNQEKTLEVLMRRLAHPLPAVLRTDLELEVAQLLFSMERAEESEALLRSALKRSPEQVSLLKAHAQSAERLEKWSEAVASLRKACEQLPAGEEQILLLRQLATLADQKLERKELAMDAYEAILGQSPGDLGVMNSLVDIFSSLHLTDRATTLQTEVIQRTEPAEAKVRSVVKLAYLYHTLAKDRGKALSTLERASRAWPLDAQVLSVRAELLGEAGESGARRMLVERAGKEARRQLESGRLELGLLDTLATSLKLLSQNAQAQRVESAMKVLQGTGAKPESGYGPAALDAGLNAGLAPSPLSRALAALLGRTASALDLAFSFDPARSGAKKVDPQSLPELVSLAKAIGLTDFELYAAPGVPGGLIPATHEPPRFLVEQSFSSRAALEQRFLILRALKLHTLGVASFARLPVEDGAAILGGLLLLFSPNFRPPGGEVRKIGQARALLEQAFTRTGYTNDVPTLALEAVGALGSASLSRPGLSELANRAAFLGAGNLDVAARALAQAPPLPDAGAPRLRWFESEPEAMDLLLFQTSEAYLKLSERLGRR